MKKNKIAEKKIQTKNHSAESLVENATTSVVAELEELELCSKS